MYYLLLICDLLFFRLITELVCQRTHRGRAHVAQNHYFGTIGNSQKWENKVFATGFILIPLQEAYIQVCIWKIWTHNLTS